MLSEVTMQPRTMALAGRPFREILAALLLVVSLLGCVLALPFTATAQANPESPLVINEQVNGLTATGAVPGVSSMTGNSANSTLSASRPGTTAVNPVVGTLLPNYDSTYLAGCEVAAIGCLVLAVFAFIWLLRLPVIDAQASRRLLFGLRGLIPRLELFMRAPSLIALSISRT